MSKDNKKYYKDPRFGHVYGYTVATPKGRLIWPQLVEPGEGYEYKGQQVEGKYEATILLDAKSKDTERFMDIIKDQAQVMEDMFNAPSKNSAGKGKGKKIKLSLDFDQIFTHADDADWVDQEAYPYYKDTIILKARSSKPPVVRQADGKGAFDVADLEGGMIVVFGVAPMITSSGGVTFQLKIVQFVKDDGKRFGGGGFNINKVADEVLSDLTSGDDDEESDTPFEDAADEALGSGKKAKKKVVEEEDDDEDDSTDDDTSDEEDDEEEESLESDEDEDEDDDSEEDEEESDDEDSDDDDEEEESDDEEEDEEEESPKKSSVKKAPPAQPLKRGVTAEDIKKKAAANKEKLRKELHAKSGKRSAIDRL